MLLFIFPLNVKDVVKIVGFCVQKGRCPDNYFMATILAIKVYSNLKTRCLMPKNTTQCPLATLESKPLELESSLLISLRPLHLRKSLWGGFLFICYF